MKELQQMAYILMNILMRVVLRYGTYVYVLVCTNILTKSIKPFTVN